MSNRIESLQILRIVAAAMVALYHIEQAARTAHGLPADGGLFGNIGSVGVDIFFVLSGYIIAHTARGMRAGDFFARRFARVVPVYWVATLAFLPFVSGFDPGRGIASLAFYPGFGLPLLAVGWTLCFEMLFYAVTAAVLLRPREFLPLALGAYAACWVARLWLGGPFQFLGNPLILEFLFGVALTRLPARSPLMGLAAIGTGGALLGVVAVQGIADGNNLYGLLAGETALARVAAMGVPAALIVWGALNFELRPSWLSGMGDASYALYLFHSHVIAAMLLAPAMPVVAFMVVAMALAIGAGLAAHHWLEKPLVACARRPLVFLQPIPATP